LGAYHRYGKEKKEDIEADMGYVFNLFPILKERQKQMAGTLSGGEQQMLAIGRGLMAKPQLLLLDEPSLGLAPLLVREIFRVMTDLREHDTTILLVEQNARAALGIADRAYVLETGEVALEGTAEELLADERVQSAYLGKGYK
jgi:branched-chain amino acid transport system ATP-binding protein